VTRADEPRLTHCAVPGPGRRPWLTPVELVEG
jgi:hypothetical protein